MDIFLVKIELNFITMLGHPSAQLLPPLHSVGSQDPVVGSLDPCSSGGSTALSVPVPDASSVPVLDPPSASPPGSSARS